MPRYYFDIDYGKLTIDDEDGDEFDSLDQACARADAIFREIVSNRILERLSLPRALIVRDEFGNIIKSLPIRSLFSDLS